MASIPQHLLADYLIAGTAWHAVSRELTNKHARQALEWYRSVAGQGHYHLPLFLVVDLGIMLLHGYQTSFASDVNYQNWPESERALRLRYENELFGRLLQEPDLLACIELVRLARRVPETHLRLLTLLIGKLAPHYPRTFLVHPGHVRDLMLADPDEREIEPAVQRLADVLDSPPTFGELLSGFLDQIAGNLRMSRLLDEADLFELEHWEVLDTEEIRIGCRQIIDVERQLGDIDVRRLPIVIESPDTDTAFVDETYYPTGGIAEVTNRGAFESLVLSELAYMEPAEEIDLFDVRFVEGELLFYTRDSGQLRRKRRRIHLVIDLQESFLLKSSGYAYQFSILTQGLMMRLVRDLGRVFPLDALKFVFHYLYRKQEPLGFAREMRLMKLLMGDEVEHGRVDFSLTSGLELASLAEVDHKVYVVVVCDSNIRRWYESLANQALEIPGMHGAILEVGSHERRDPEQESALLLPLDGLPLTGVALLRDELIRQLVGVSSR